MTYLSIVLILLNVVFVGLALCYLRPSVWRRGDRGGASRITTDASQASSLFGLVHETLQAHAEALAEVPESRQSQDSRPSPQAKSHQETAQSLDDNSGRLDEIMVGYGDLYRAERDRIRLYAQRARKLDLQLGQLEQNAIGEDKFLLDLVRQMVRENSQLRAKVSSCQQQVSELIAQSVKSGREARTDSLTQLPNRRAWDERLTTVEMDGNASVALIDVDKFKRINDRFGHAAGDATLTLIGTILRKFHQVLAYRIGGDEFALLMPQHDPRIHDQICEKIGSAALQFGEAKIQTAVSIGVAIGNPGEPIQSVLIRADNALYAAKQSGGNQVHSSADTLEASLDESFETVGA